jgi:hypothetical protein
MCCQLQPGADFYPQTHRPQKFTKMEPLSALSLATAVIQIVDFSSKVITRAREVSRSADGTIDETAILENAAVNLNDLLTQLQMITGATSSGHGALHPNTPDQQLLQYAKDSQDVATELRRMLNNVKHKKDGRQRVPLTRDYVGCLSRKT